MVGCFVRFKRDLAHATPLLLIRCYGTPLRRTQLQVNIDNLKDAPGVYAVQLPDGVVKFGQSKTVKSRVQTHVRTLRSYGVPVLDVAAVYVNHCEDAEKDLFARLTAAGYERRSNSRESYILPWDVARQMLPSAPRPAYLRFTPWLDATSDAKSEWHLTAPSMHDWSNFVNLDCSACGWDMTHLLKVEKSHRGEDRRLAVTLLFGCEECGALTTVEFINHKGQTVVSATIVPDEEVAA